MNVVLFHVSPPEVPSISTTQLAMGRYSRRDLGITRRQLTKFSSRRDQLQKGPAIVLEWFLSPILVPKSKVIRLTPNHVLRASFACAGVGQ